MNKIYIDVETTGLKAGIHGIISLSYIITDIKDKELTRDTLLINPLSYTSGLSIEALEINNFTEEQLSTFPNAKIQAYKLYNDIREYGKLKVIAYNATFDTEFIKVWWDKLLPNTYWKIFDYKHLDPFELVKILQNEGYIDLPDHKLGTVCEYFGIEHNPHENKSDIKATRELYILLTKRISYDKTK